MFQLTDHQQGQVNWLRGSIEHLGEDKYRLTTDYRENSPSYEFTEAELVDTLEKATDIYADWDESA